MTELVATVALLLVPGLLVGVAAGLRGWALAGTAPLLTYAVVALAGAVCTSTGLRWSPGVLVAAVAVVAGLAAAGTWAWERRSATPAAPPPWDAWRSLAVGAATALGCSIGVGIVLAATDGFDGVAQDWDAHFHTSAIRFIADTGDADPAALAAINRYDEPQGFYYPNTYYLFASVVYRVSGGSVPVVHDATLAVVPAVLTLGLVALLHAVRARAALAAATAVVSVAAAALPWDLLLRGPLTPYATGVALVPAFLALLARLLDPPGGRRSPAVAALVGASAAALMTIHPSVAITAAVFAICFLAQRWLSSPRRLPRDAVWLAVVAGVALLASVPAILGSLDSVADAGVFQWPADLPAWTAIGELVGFNARHGGYGHLAPHPRWTMVVLLVVGLTAVRHLRPAWFVLAGSTVFAVLFVLSGSYGQAWVGALNRPWWNDRWRLAAIAALGAILLAAHGAVVLSDLLRRVLAAATAALAARAPSRVRPVLAWAPPVVVAALVAQLSGGFYARDSTRRVAPQFGDGPGLSHLEREGIDVLATLVPEGARVMNQRDDGSPSMYAIAGVRPVAGHIEVDWISPTQDLLQRRFNRLDTDPEVQAAVARLDIEYVYLGEGYVRGWFTRAEGLRDLDRVRSLALVYENPDVQIYRVLPRPPSPAG